MKDLDIKKMWDEAIDDGPKGFDSKHITQIIEKGSISVISKFIGALKLEMWLNFTILTGIATYLAFEKKWAVSVFLFAVDFIYFFYYIKLIKRLSEKSIDTSVLQYLQLVHIIINKFIAHYKVANVILAAPLFMSGMYFANPDIFTAKYFSNEWFIVLLFAGFAVAILFLYLFLYFLYGKKANKIKSLIQELEED